MRCICDRSRSFVFVRCFVVAEGYCAIGYGRGILQNWLWQRDLRFQDVGAEVCTAVLLRCRERFCDFGSLGQRCVLRFFEAERNQVQALQVR